MRVVSAMLGAEDVSCGKRHRSRDGSRWSPGSASRTRRVLPADDRARVGRELLGDRRPATRAARRSAPRPPGGRRRRRRTRRARAPSTGTSNTCAAIAPHRGVLRRAADRAAPRCASTPWPRTASRPSASPHSIPSIAARAIDGRVVFASVSPENDAVASGRFGVRSPSKYGTSTAPDAPGSASSASRPSSAWSTPSRPAVASSTRAALSVAMSGRKSPVASAKPATVPEASAIGASVTAKTVPLVPIDTTTSPDARVEAERGRRVVARPGADERCRSGVRPAASRGAEHAREDRVVPERRARAGRGRSPSAPQ